MLVMAVEGEQAHQEHTAEQDEHAVGIEGSRGAHLHPEDGHGAIDGGVGGGVGGAGHADVESLVEKQKGGRRDYAAEE